MKIRKEAEEIHKDWFDRKIEDYEMKCYAYAERWADLMEKAIENSGEEPRKVIYDKAKELMHKANKEEITYLMHSVATNYLYACWEHGLVIKDWYDENIKG